MIPSVDKGTHGRRRANFFFCFVAFFPRTSSTRQSSALQGQKLTSFRLSDPDHRYSGNLQGGRLRRTERTLIEDNADKLPEYHGSGRVCPCSLRVRFKNEIIIFFPGVWQEAGGEIGRAHV